MNKNINCTSNGNIQTNDKTNVDENENDDANSLDIENISLLRTIMQVVGKQVTTIVVDLLTKHMAEFQNASAENQIDIMKLQEEIGKVSSNVKDFENYFNKHKNNNIEWKENINTSHIQLKQDLGKLEKQLRYDMKQHQIAMEKIDKLFKFHLNFDTSADCARMVDIHNTIENHRDTYCTRIQHAL